jgi:alkanesulfonate monooxygenase SsuD/methylene tetrahydromethanopterin reductase-like flavin-dependent oxidoreductase (luciferase family)
MATGSALLHRADLAWLAGVGDDVWWFDSILAPEHHFTDYGFCASPMVTLAAMASVTSRILLGSGVVVLPFNDPVRVAEEGAMVDLISEAAWNWVSAAASNRSNIAALLLIRPSHARSSIKRCR